MSRLIRRLWLAKREGDEERTATYCVSMSKVRLSMPVQLHMSLLPLDEHPHLKDRGHLAWDFLILLRKLQSSFSNILNVKQDKQLERECMHTPVRTFAELKSTY